jgi:CitMHS family citrate-Mg2+:H+ or citrate-Ca2+:H+ symporter
MQVDVANVFVPLIPAMLTGAVYVLAVAAYFGVKERRRLGVIEIEGLDVAASPAAHRRPRRTLINLAMTAVLMWALIQGILPLHILFLFATVLAMMVNYPTLEEQKERLQAHAYNNVMSVIGLIFAAGVFTGVLNGTGMIGAMSKGLLAVIPPDFGPYLAPVSALHSGVAPILSPTTPSTLGSCRCWRIWPRPMASAASKWPAPHCSASRCTCSARWSPRRNCWPRCWT